MATTSVRVVKEHIGRPRSCLVNCWTGCVWFIDISHSSKTIRVRCVQPKRRRPPPLKASSGRCTAFSFLRPDKLGDRDLRRYGKEVGLDLERFDREMASGIYADQILKD